MKNKCDNCEDFYSCVLGLIESCEYKNEFLKNTDIMNYIKVGKENAITRKELCALTGMEDRAIREHISQARRFVPIINLQDGSGYFIPNLEKADEISELKHFVAQEEKRLKSIGWSLYAARKALKGVKHE